MTLQVPGKTFLVGEYSVLAEGLSLGIATKPYFIFTDSEFTAQPDTYLTHPDSAAGLFLKSGPDHQRLPPIVNPYQVGGFGLSTAEFIQAWCLKRQCWKITTEIFPQIYNDYRSVFDRTPDLQRIKPSGADVMTQLVGGIAYFNSKNFSYEKLNWPFAEIEFSIISTGQKIPTHEHLKQVNRQGLENFPNVSNPVVQMFLNKDQPGFLEGLKNWRDFLRDRDMQHNISCEIVEVLERKPEVLLAKPNGALGADTITVFYKHVHKVTVKNYFKDLKLSLITDRDQLAQGAQYVD